MEEEEGRSGGGNRGWGKEEVRRGAREMISGVAERGGSRSGEEKTPEDSRSGEEEGCRGGYDPAYLLPSLPEAEFAVAFEDATRISSQRFNYPVPLIWKIKRALNIGSERKLKEAVDEIREFAKRIVKENKAELEKKFSIDSVDLLSRFLSSGHSDEDFVTDIVISFILAGRDTTSAALKWFFWLVFGNPEVEKKIVQEIKEKFESPVYDEVKDMIYTHASLCETMRLYPPVPTDGKEAARDDVLPDGTVVKKGTRVTR